MSKTSTASDTSTSPSACSRSSEGSPPGARWAPAATSRRTPSRTWRGRLRRIVGAAAALYVATGYGLLKRMSWGRVLGLIGDAVSLLSFPIGTALGAYTLWALTRPEAQEEFA